MSLVTLLDLMHQHGIEPRKVGDLHGGEYHSPCPSCGGKDRFHINPSRPSTGSCTVPGFWGCRGCDDSGDIISFLIKYNGLSFVDACKMLNINAKYNTHKPVILRQNQRKPQFTAQVVELPPLEWQEKNTLLVQKAHDNLLANPQQLAWLAARGLDEDAVRRFTLGWLYPCPNDKRNGWYTRPRNAWGLADQPRPDGTSKRFFKFPYGLVIPRIAPNGKTVGLRIRRTPEDRQQFDPSTKYMAFRGAKVVPLLILPEGYAIEQVTIVVVEAELDAMLIGETARKNNLPIGVLAVLSNMGKPDAIAHEACQKAARLLIAMDFGDENKAGDKGVLFWLSTYPRAKDWPVPAGKDPGDAFKAGVDMAMWLHLGLPPVFQPVQHVGATTENTAQPLPAQGNVIAAKAENLGQGGGAQAPAVEQSIPAQTTLAPSGVPAQVHGVYTLFQRYPDVYFEVSNSPLSFGFRPHAWLRKNIHVLDELQALVNTKPFQDWLDTHPVQNGIIDKLNLLARR